MQQQFTQLPGVGCLMLLTLASALAATPEKLVNPGFAQAGAGGLAQQWNNASYLTTPQFEWTTLDGRTAQKMSAAEVPRGGFAALAQNLPALEPGYYRLRARVRAERALTAEAQVRLSPAPYTSYGRARVELPPNTWTDLRALAIVPTVQGRLWFMISLPQPGALWVAEASLTPVAEADLTPEERRYVLVEKGPPLPPVDEAQLLAETDARIQRARTAPLHITVTDAAGRPAARQEVRVEHLRHLFFFGAGFDRRLIESPNETEIDQRHRDLFLKLFNYSTVHLYWGGYEPRPGEPQSASRQQYARWIKDKGLIARGHPVFWNQDNVLPRWLMERRPDPPALRALMDERLKEMSATILPELRDADIFNEITHWERFADNPMTRLFQAQGKVAVIAQYLKEARRLNPRLQLLVNDYDTSPAYYVWLKEILETGAPMDIIGQQSHMHSGNWSVRQTWDILNRLSLLGRPVLFTEHSVLSGPRRDTDWRSTTPDWNTDPENEARQADYLEQFYRLLYSHTNCIGIVLWNYTDRGAWLGAPVGVLRKDGTPKPSYERLDALINQKWRTRGTFTTDARGQITVPAAFEGEYRITAGNASATGEHRARQPLRVQLRR